MADSSNGNGHCNCDERIGRLLRAARRELWKVEPYTIEAAYLLGELRILDVLARKLDEGQYAAPVVRPKGMCAWPPQPCASGN